jgi:hypothetical protein
VAGAGDDVAEVLERLEAATVDQAGADHDVLVGEGEHRPAVLVVHERLEHGVPLRRALHRRQADEHAWRAADALERAEREALELPGVTDLGDEHPRLGHLRQQSGLVAARAIGTEVSHLGQLGVGQRRAVLGLDLDRHDLVVPPGS